MLHGMCGESEECMLDVWHSCKEQPKCVMGVYQKHMAEAKQDKQGTPPAASHPLAENATAHVRSHPHVHTATFCAGCVTVKYPNAISADFCAGCVTVQPQAILCTALRFPL